MAARRIRFDVSGRSLLKVVLAVALVWTWLRLWQWILLFVVSIFIAVGLDPIVSWLEARRLKRAYGSVLAVGALAAVLIAFAYLAGAQLLEQGRMLGDRLDDLQQELMHRVPEGWLQLLPQRQQGQEGQLASYATR